MNETTQQQLQLHYIVLDEAGLMRQVANDMHEHVKVFKDPELRSYADNVFDYYLPYMRKIVEDVKLAGISPSDEAQSLEFCHAGVEVHVMVSVPDVTNRKVFRPVLLS